MHPIAAAAASSDGYGFWAYVVVFALVTVGWAGIPGIGGAVIGLAAVTASQGKLNIAGVLVAAAFGVEAGGMLGYHVGQRWGPGLLTRPGRRQAQRAKLLTSGEALYQRWGRLAVFVTPSFISGIVEMPYPQFVVWNFLAGLVFVLSVGPGAYGAGKVATGHHDSASVGALAGGLAVAALAVLAGRWYYRRRKAGKTPPAEGDASAKITALQIVAPESAGQTGATQRPAGDAGTGQTGRQPAQQPGNGATGEQR